jgi:hypothetical protein
MTQDHRRPGTLFRNMHPDAVRLDDAMLDLAHVRPSAITASSRR